MSISKSPVTKWYVTEYPEEGSFAVTDGYEIFATIIGGKTIGDECDLASRIAKLPDLERERDEAMAALMKIEEIFVDGCDTFADRIAMGEIARSALEDGK